MISRHALVAEAARAADGTLTARPAHLATTTGHVVEAALPTIAAAILDQVAAGVRRSMTPAQVRELLDEIRQEVSHG